ncbi:hypothetical protein [Alteromonas sp. CYL-A6]|uniref:hypothetical protein n=1 Tax=Alteromonas nitratireducens TaxID=3390813 RepID=UPI0034C1885E
MTDFFESHYRYFLGWECRCINKTSSHEYDAAIKKLRDLLRNHTLIGYHCTKLTKKEITHIEQKGMQLQNAESLKERILSLKSDRVITADIAELLIERNQADDVCRKNKLWFCFFEPLLDPDGIKRLFRSWGGEALYNLHEHNPKTGQILREIGTPCVIKAKVPVIDLIESYYPDSPMIRTFLSKKGHQIENSTEHEGFSIRDISVQNIIQIIRHPSKEFQALTLCNC